MKAVVIEGFDQDLMSRKPRKRKSVFSDMSTNFVLFLLCFPRL